MVGASSQIRRPTEEGCTRNAGLKGRSVILCFVQVSRPKLSSDPRRSFVWPRGFEGNDVDKDGRATPSSLYHSLSIVKRGRR